MSIYFAGTFQRSGGEFAAICKQIRNLNFKGVKRISVTFDPFHEKAPIMRDYLSYISSPKLATNFPNFSIKTDIVCQRETPTVTFQFVPAVETSEKLKRLRIEANNLTVLELLKITNEQVSKRAPKDEIVSSAKTKSEKKGGAAKRK